MGKQSKRAGRAARDVHAAVRTAAEFLKSTGRTGVRDANEFPEVAELLHACREEVAKGVPRTIVFAGRTYWLRVRLAAIFDVFDTAAAAEPLLRGASFSSDEHGY